MREIKFRAWDKEENKMIEWDDTFFSDMSPVTRWSSYFSFIEMPLMQFTGLKDHSGDDIYEGDIVIGTSRLDENWNPLQKVHFLNGCFMFGNWNAHEYFNKHTEIEIVGNKYENPELLSK